MIWNILLPNHLRPLCSSLIQSNMALRHWKDCPPSLHQQQPPPPTSGRSLYIHLAKERMIGIILNHGLSCSQKMPGLKAIVCPGIYLIINFLTRSWSFRDGLETLQHLKASDSISKCRARAKEKESAAEMYHSFIVSDRPYGTSPIAWVCWEFWCQREGEEDRNEDSNVVLSRLNSTALIHFIMLALNTIAGWTYHNQISSMAHKLDSRLKCLL